MDKIVKGGLGNVNQNRELQKLIRQKKEFMTGTNNLVTDDTKKKNLLLVKSGSDAYCVFSV